MSDSTNQKVSRLPRREPTRDTPRPNRAVHVEGNVSGLIVTGDKNRIQFEVNNDYGVVINDYSKRQAVKRWDVKPQPPSAPREFIGRENELKTLDGLIKPHGAVIVHGHDGIGKTTLVKQAAQSSAASAMRDGVVFERAIGEAGKSLEFEDLLQRLFDALYESNPPLKVSASTAKTHLGNTKPLVILDGFDLPPADLISLPDYFPQGSLLVTRQSSYPGEGFDSVALLPLPRNQSVELLITKAGLQRNAQEITLLNEVCQSLEDVPLAITTIAKAIREKRTTVADATSQLKRLQSPSSDKTQGAIERSFALVSSFLNMEERVVLIAAAAAEGTSLDREMLEGIAGREAINSIESLELLQANSPRLRLPDGLKQFIRSDPNNTSIFRKKLLDRLTQQLETRALDFDFISDELGNLLGLIRWAESEKRWEDVIQLGRAIDPYLTLRGLWDAWQTVLQQILSAADQLSDTATRAWALHQLGSREIGAGSVPQARKLLVHALRIREAIGDEIGAAYTRHNLGITLSPKEGNDDSEIDTPPGGGGTGPIREWLGRRGWLIPIAIAAAIVVGLVWYFWPRQLELSIQAEQQIYVMPTDNTIRYTYFIRNTGDTRIEGPIRIDSDITGLVDCPNTSTAGNFDEFLDPNETLNCHSVYDITGEDIERGSVTNLAQALSNDKIMSKRVTFTIVLEPTKAEITLSKVPDNMSYNHVDQIITYTYTILNSGNSFLKMPVEVMDNKMTVDCGEANEGDLELKFLQPKESINCTARYVITQTDLDQGSMTNIAAAMMNGIKSNEASVTITAEKIPELILTINFDPATYERVGQMITYTYTIENKGNTTFNSLPTITDSMLTPSCPITNSEGTAFMPPKTTILCTSSYVITQNDLDNGSVTNRATARVDNISSKESIATINANPRPALTLTKSSDRSVYGRVGEIVTYTYTVTNTGNVTLGPAQLTITDERIEGNTPFPCGANQAILPVNGTLSCTATYAIKLTDIDNKSVTNYASASILYKEKVIGSQTTSTTIILQCPPPPSDWDKYIIKRGNTLYKISLLYNRTIADFQQANCMGSSTDLIEGNILYVPYLVTIDGLFFYDTNGNHQKDSDESVIPSFRVTLEGGDENPPLSALTENDGKYSFSKILPGSYKVLGVSVQYETPFHGVMNFGLVPIP